MDSCRNSINQNLFVLNEAKNEELSKIPRRQEAEDISFHPTR